MSEDNEISRRLRAHARYAKKHQANSVLSCPCCGSFTLTSHLSQCTTKPVGPVPATCNIIHAPDCSVLDNYELFQPLILYAINSLRSSRKPRLRGLIERNIYDIVSQAASEGRTELSEDEIKQVQSLTVIARAITMRRSRS